MFLNLGTGLLLVLGCFANHSRNLNGYPRALLYDEPDVSSEKRSAQIFGSGVLTGMRIVRNLLTGATKITSNSPTRHYVKTGGYHQAVKDFKKAAPKNVQTFPTMMKTVGRIGDVGDKQLILKYNGQDRAASLEIRELEATPIGKLALISGKVTDKISYPEANQMHMFE